MNYALPSCCKTLYMWIMQCYLVARHYICELCNAMLLSQSSCMWIISCYNFFVLRVPFVDNVCIFNYSSCASAIWSGDGSIWSENKYSEQTMLPAEADILLVTESSLEEDSETDDQSYFPPEVYAQTWQGYITHVMHVVLHCLVFTSYMDCHLLTCLLYKSYIWIISCHHVYIHSIYLNYGMATHLIKTSYSYIISSCLVFTVIIFWIMSFYMWIISCYHVSIGGMYVNYGMPTYLINTLYSYVMSSCLHSLIFWTMSFHLF